MPFDCQVCATEKKFAGANVCQQCDNMVCQDCWKNWCDSDINQGKRWAEVTCPFCRSPVGTAPPLGSVHDEPAQGEGQAPERWVLPHNVRVPLSYRDARPAAYWERRRERAVRESGRRDLGAPAAAPAPAPAPAPSLVRAPIYRVEADGTQVPDALSLPTKPGMCKGHTRDWKPCRYKGAHDGYCRTHLAQVVLRSASGR